MTSDNRFHILPECYVDTCVCEVLLQLGDKKPLNKKHGVGSVANEFYQNPKGNSQRNNKPAFLDSPALAIIDRDKLKIGASDFFRDGKNFNIISTTNGINLAQRKTKADHYVIIIDPVMERFLLSCAKNVGVTTSDYPFLENLPSLLNISKSKNIRENVEFKKFVKLLIKKESEEILTLKNWLEQFYNNLTIEA